MATPREGHAVTTIPAERFFKDADPPSPLQPVFFNPVVNGLDFYHGVVTIALIQLPCLYVSIKNLVKSIGRRRPAMALRSLAIVIIPFPFLQTLITLLMSFLLQKFPTFKEAPSKHSDKHLQSKSD